jgi:hypothetical protein
MSRPSGEPQARKSWLEALAILEDMGSPAAGQVRGKLAATNE